MQGILVRPRAPSGPPPSRPGGSVWVVVSIMNNAMRSSPWLALSSFSRSYYTRDSGSDTFAATQISHAWDTR